MQTVQVIITTIISIAQSIRSLFSFFHQKKIEKENLTDQKKELKKEEENLKDLIKEKKLKDLNNLAGWKD